MQPGRVRHEQNRTDSSNYLARANFNIIGNDCELVAKLLHTYTHTFTQSWQIKLPLWGNKSSQSSAICLSSGSIAPLLFASSCAWELQTRSVWDVELVQRDAWSSFTFLRKENEKKWSRYVSESPSFKRYVLLSKCEQKTPSKCWRQRKTKTKSSKYRWNISSENMVNYNVDKSRRSSSSSSCCVNAVPLIPTIVSYQQYPVYFF